MPLSQQPKWSEAEAKQFAAGPGGEIMVKYPLQYCKAAFLGERPRMDGTSKIFNGTATFLSLESGVYAVTCAHVVDAYFQVLEQNGSALFQIGMTEIALVNQLTCKNDVVDLATIRLSDSQVKDFSTQGQIGSRVIQPTTWPPTPVEAGQTVMFGGFPGAWRERAAYDELVFGSFSSAGVTIASSHPDRFSCQFEREYWVRSLARGDSDKTIHLRELGGLSGGPAFVDRGLHFEFAGIIYQHSEAFDLLFLRPAGLIHADGSIAESL